MNLSILDLLSPPSSTKTGGTGGTGGTRSTGAGSSVPPQFLAGGTGGTRSIDAGSGVCGKLSPNVHAVFSVRGAKNPSVPPVPPLFSEGGTENPNVYAVVPPVPLVPPKNIEGGAASASHPQGGVTDKPNLFSTATHVAPIPGYPREWGGLLEGRGYRVKGHRATCPLCPPEKTGLAVSITAWGIHCFRDPSHSRSWPVLVDRSGVPVTFRKAAGRSRAVKAAEADRWLLARQAAAEEWTFAKPAPEDHPYLRAKHIPPMGARADDASKLLVPLYGIGRMFEILFSLERIAPDGQKRFETGCRVRGGYCFVRTDWESVDRPSRLGRIPEPHPAHVWICEGFATAATVALATKEVACCVFSAGNLNPALEVLTGRLPRTEFFIAADNDRETPGNPGLKAALEVAKRFGLRVALPEFPASTQGSDWNDLATTLDNREQPENEKGPEVVFPKFKGEG